MLVYKSSLFEHTRIAIQRRTSRVYELPGISLSMGRTHPDGLGDNPVTLLVYDFHVMFLSLVMQYDHKLRGPLVS